ncbi:MAG: carbohydrate ABC transporter permease [Bdellovibrionales bacterium]|nr:carbohydrate ABC transporter permease [Bdellovibrionales bacterium]
MKRGFIYFALSVLALYFAAPLALMLVTSLRDEQEIRSGLLLSLPKSFSLIAWREAWSTACIGLSCEGLQPYFWNSVRMVVPAVIISTTLGALNGYVLSHWRFRGSETFFGLLLLGSFIPFQVIILPMARVLGQLELANSNAGLVMVHSIYGLAFTTLFFRNFYVSIPSELIKAARIDGAGFFTIFRRIILPLSPPIIVVTVIWQFTGIWNDFLFGAVFSSGGAQPITVALNNLVNTSTGEKHYNVDMAATLITAAPTLMIYILAGKYFVRGLTAGSVKG